MPTPNPSKVAFYTGFKYFLNYDEETNSVSVPSTSYAAGEAKAYSVSIPVERSGDFSQVKLNFSFDSSKWYIFPQGDLVLDLAFGTVSTVGSYSSTQLTLTFYVVNQTPGIASNPAFTVTAKASLFVTPG